jgi:hypothetical protein
MKDLVDLMRSGPGRSRDEDQAQRSDLVDIALNVFAATDKALFLSDTDKNRAKWIPRSLVEDYGNGLYAMPEWVAKQRGWMAAKDAVSGPLPRERLRELVEAPHGHAAKEIQKYDPQWGRRDGEKFEWEVRCTAVMTGRAIVLASSQDEADKAADELSEAEIDWEIGGEGFEVESVEVVGRK